MKFPRFKIQPSMIRSLIASVLSITIGLGLGAIIFFMTKTNPLLGYASIIGGAFGSAHQIAETTVKMTPLLIGGLGLALAFKSGYLNIGAEGQMLFGACLAAGVGFYFKGMPSMLHIPAVILAGIIGGGLWATIPGVLKAKLQVNEILTTFMMNYIAYWIAHYLVRYPWKDPNRLNPQSFPIAPCAELPKLIPNTRAHLGFLLGILIIILAYVVLKYTKFGYQIKTVGANPEAAKYGGMNVPKTIIIISVMSGLLCGLAGACEIAGVHLYLRDDVISGYGYTAIAVAYLGGLDPVGVAFAALFFAVLLNGVGYMQRIIRIPSTSAFIFVGVLILCTLLSPLIKEFLKRIL